MYLVVFSNRDVYSEWDACGTWFFALALGLARRSESIYRPELKRRIAMQQNESGAHISH